MTYRHKIQKPQRPGISFHLSYQIKSNFLPHLMVFHSDAALCNHFLKNNFTNSSKNTQYRIRKTTYRQRHSQTPRIARHQMIHITRRHLKFLLESVLFILYSPWLYDSKIMSHNVILKIYLRQYISAKNIIYLYYYNQSEHRILTYSISAIMVFSYSLWFFFLSSYKIKWIKKSRSGRFWWGES